jgi:hypothetical protein
MVEYKWRKTAYIMSQKAKRKKNRWDSHTLL